MGVGVRVLVCVGVTPRESVWENDTVGLGDWDAVEESEMAGVSEDEDVTDEERDVDKLTVGEGVRDGVAVTDSVELRDLLRVPVELNDREGVGVSVIDAYCDGVTEAVLPCVPVREGVDPCVLLCDGVKPCEGVTLAVRP